MKIFKKLFPIIAILLVATIVIDCQPETEIDVQIGKLVFTLHDREIDSGGRVNGTLRPTTLIVSLSDLEGHQVKDHVSIKLVQFGQGYISEGLELPFGDYVLTDFLVLSSHGSIIYACPKDSSPRAKFVKDALPILVRLSEDEVSMAVEVLGVDVNENPENFGYVSFNFSVVKVAGLEIPLEAGEHFTRLHLEFINEPDTIVSEVVPSTSVSEKVFFFSDSVLLDKKWQMTLVAFAEPKGCIQKVYRYQAELTFKGNIMMIPTPGDENWTPLYYAEHDGVIVLRSIDPRHSHFVEIRLPHGGYSFYGYVDRAFWGEEQLCDMYYKETGEWKGKLVVTMSDPEPLCTNPEKLRFIDSMILLDMLPAGFWVDMFVWEVDGAGIRPTCPDGSSGGRSRTLPSRAGRPGGRTTETK